MAEAGRRCCLPFSRPARCAVGADAECKCDFRMQAKLGIDAFEPSHECVGVHFPSTRSRVHERVSEAAFGQLGETRAPWAYLRLAGVRMLNPPAAWLQAVTCSGFDPLTAPKMVAKSLHLLQNQSLMDLLVSRTVRSDDTAIIGEFSLQVLTSAFDFLTVRRVLPTVTPRHSDCD